MEPARLGKYELVRHLASGGMASVYLARVSGLGGFERHVVLKTLRASGLADDDTLVPMFLDEARLVATLHHQHIAQVFEVGCEDSTYFLAMEYVHGETVRHVMETMRQCGRALPLDFCLTVICAAAAGLHHAHERRGTNGEPLGIVHRDVTPSNVIASYDGSIKLIDFGIAKAAVRATVTRSGLIKGKVGYMAPEQVRGFRIDRRSDVFALGVLTYELTTQSRAFDGGSQFEQLERTARGDIIPPSHIVAGYPKSLEKIVLTALEVDPDDRYPDTQAMRAELVRLARELGLSLGESAVIRVLTDLFGSRPEPWLVRVPANDPIEVIETPPIEIVRPFVRARGTGADDADADDADVDEEVTTHPIDLVETRDFVKTEAETPPSPAPMVAPPTAPSSMPPPPLPPPLPRAATMRAPSTVFAAVEPPLTPNPPPLPRAATMRAPSTEFAAVEPPLTPSPPPLPAAPARASSVVGVEPAQVPSRAPARASRSIAAEPMPAASQVIATMPMPSRAPVPTAATLAPPPPSSTIAAEPAPMPTIASRRGWLAAGIAVAIALGTLAAIMVSLWGGHDMQTPTPAVPARATPSPATPSTPSTASPSTASPSSTSPSTAPPSSASPSTSPSPTSPPAIVPAPVTPPAGPRAGHVMLEVTTDPPDATVVLDGVRLGRTPYRGEVPVKPGGAWLKVRKKRYVPVKQRRSLESDVIWHVELRARAH